jgi:uncharacterized protein DUF6263
MSPKSTVMYVALALVACDKSDGSKAKPSPTNDGVELVTTGQATDQRVLRYHLTRATTSQIELAMSLDMDAGGRANKLPTLAMTLETTVTDVAADGTATIHTTVKAAHARERPGSTQLTPVMAQMTGQLVGLGFTAKLSSGGKLTDTKLDTQGLAAPLGAQLGQLTQSLEQLAMPLPEYPVGVGAKWQTRRTAKQDGLELTTVTTVELTAIDGDKVTFTSTSTVSAPDQQLTKDGITVAVKDVGGGGTSKGTIDLGRMMMTGEFSLEFRGTMSAEGQTAPMRMQMSMTLVPAVAQGAQSAP